MKRSDLKNERVAVLRMAFRARKVFGTFEKLAQVGQVIEKTSATSSLATTCCVQMGVRMGDVFFIFYLLLLFT